MNDKLNKYIKKYFNIDKKNKKKKYSKKISQIGGYSYKSVDQVLSYISKEIKNIELTNEDDHRYCLVLFGPPASGKSKAVDLGIDLINKDRSSSLKRQNFFELNIDNFVENTDEWDLFKKNDLKLEKDIEYNQNLYQEIRTDINQIFELFLHCCILLKLNFTLESTGTNFKWHIETLKELKNEFQYEKKNKILKDYGYSIVVMYPYTENLDMLAQRAQQRSISTGRILTKNDFIKFDFIKKASWSFENLILQNTKYFYIICKYDGDIEKEKKNLETKNILVYFINRQKRDEEDRTTSKKIEVLENEVKKIKERIE
jgi:hypothetical protein